MAVLITALQTRLSDLERRCKAALVINAVATVLMN